MSVAEAAAARPAGSAIEHTIEGRAVRLPVEVRDASSCFATFLVPSAAARRLFPQTSIELAEIVPGRALCSVAAIEYRDNDLGRYHELAVAFPVRRTPGSALPFLGMVLDFRSGRGGVYIHRLPVTTAFSCAAGREIWGFPKTVDAIDIQDAGGWRTARLDVDGEPALTLSVKRRGRLSFRELPLDAYSIASGVVRRTPFVSSGEGAGMGFGGATLALGRGTIADELRGLGFPRRPLFSGWIGKMSSRFEAPEEIVRR